MNFFDTGDACEQQQLTDHADGSLADKVLTYLKVS
jgi:hypothetical protein